MSNKPNLFDLLGVFLVVFGWRAMTHEGCAFQLLLFYTASAQHSPAVPFRTLCRWSLDLASSLLGGTPPRLLMTSVNFSGVCGKPMVSGSLPCCVPRCPASPADVCLENGMLVSLYQCLWCWHYKHVGFSLFFWLFGVGMGGQAWLGRRNPMHPPLGCHSPQPACTEWGVVYGGIDCGGAR